MTTVFRSRQRAEEFAALVDGAAPTPPDASTDASRSSRELDRLVTVVADLRHEAAEDRATLPDAAFTADLRERLMAEALTVLTPAQATLALPPRTRTRRERRLVAAATVAVLLGGSAGMAAASQNALPGEALYPVKRALESVETRMSTSDGGRGRDLLAHATDRLDEARGLSDSRSASAAPQVSGTLDEFTSQARDGADLMMSSYSATGDEATVAAVRAFAARDLDTLAGMSVPPEAQGALERAVEALSDIDARASRACSACSDLPTLVVPSAFRASEEVDRVMDGLDPGTLNNNHPVMVPKDAVRAADEEQARSSTGQSPGPATPSSGASPTAPLTGVTGGSLPGLSGGSTTRLPKVPVKPPKVLGDTTKKVGKDVDDLGSGLGDAVGTLIPDVSGSLPQP